MIGGRLRHRAQTALLAGLVGLVAVLVVQPFADQADWGTYQAAAVRALGGDSVYSALQLSGPYALNAIAGGRGFIYPPTAVPLLAITPFFPGVVAAWAMTTLLLLVVWAMVDGWLRAAATIGVAFSPIAWDAIYVAQITPLIAASFGVLWLSQRSVWTTLFGAIKVYPLAGLTWSRQPGRDLLLLATLVLVATVWLGPSAWEQWVTAWINARPQCTAPSLGSFACLGLAPLGYVAATALLVAAWLLRGTELGFLLLTVGAVIAAPDIFANYLLVPMVGSLPLLHRLVSKAARRRISGLVAAAGTLS